MVICKSLVWSINCFSAQQHSLTHIRCDEMMPASMGLIGLLCLPIYIRRHHRLKYGNLTGKKSEAVTTTTHSKGRKRLAELKSMYEEAMQNESECCGGHCCQNVCSNTTEAVVSFDLT